MSNITNPWIEHVLAKWLAREGCPWAHVPLLDNYLSHVGLGFVTFHHAPQPWSHDGPLYHGPVGALSIPVASLVYQYQGILVQPVGYPSIGRSEP